MAPARAHELTVVFGADVQVTFSAAACCIERRLRWFRQKWKPPQTERVDAKLTGGQATKRTNTSVVGE